MRRRIHVCHMRRRIHAVSEAIGGEDPRLHVSSSSYDTHVSSSSLQGADGLRPVFALLVHAMYHQQSHFINIFLCGGERLLFSKSTHVSSSSYDTHVSSFLYDTHVSCHMSRDNVRRRIHAFHVICHVTIQSSCSTWREQCPLKSMSRKLLK
jgi:hypothetical protein